MKKRIENDEIDLIEVIVNIWNNKLKIAAITTIFMVLSVAYYFTFKPSITAKTEILPITFFENDFYTGYNSLVGFQIENEEEKIVSQVRFNNINKEYLLNLFLEELKTGKIIQDAIKNYQLIDQSKFNDEVEY